mgnify:CR=1 FL=1
MTHAEPRPPSANLDSCPEPSLADLHRLVQTVEQKRLEYQSLIRDVSEQTRNLLHAPIALPAPQPFATLSSLESLDEQLFLPDPAEAGEATAGTAFAPLTEPTAAENHVTLASLVGAVANKPTAMGRTAVTFDVTCSCPSSSSHPVTALAATQGIELSASRIAVVLDGTLARFALQEIQPGQLVHVVAHLSMARLSPAASHAPTMCAFVAESGGGVTIVKG